MATVTTTGVHEVALRTKALRMDRGWTRESLAKRLGFIDREGEWDADKVIRLEHGRIKHPPIDALRALAIVFGVTSDYLIGLEELGPESKRRGVVTQEYAIGGLDLVGCTPTPLAGDPHPPIERPEIRLPHAA